MKESIKKNRLIFIFPLLFIFYCLIGLSGYGYREDIYYMIHTGRNFILNGVYFPSRQPGYLIPEIAIGWFSLVGGFYLSNFISSLLGAGTLYLFWNMLKEKFSASIAFLTILIIGLNPYFVIEVSSSTDRVYSLFFAMAGTVLLVKRKDLFASLAFALAISSRLPNILVIFPIYLYFLYIYAREKSFKSLSHVIISGILTLSLTALLFLPIYLAYGSRFWFLLHYNDAGPWTFFGHLIRFVYKNICLFGLLPFIMLAGFILWRFFKRQVQIQLTPVFLTALLIIIACEVLFFRVPCQISYLLPLIFVIVPLWVFICRPGRIALCLLLALTVSYGFLVNVDMLDITYNKAGTEAIAADVGIFLKPGVVIKDIKQRPETAKLFPPPQYEYKNVSS